MDGRFEKFSIAITEISRYWHKLTAEEMEKYGLRGPHSIYLLTLHKFPKGITAPQICELCGKDKSDVSRMMAIMEKNGLVVKEGTNRGMYGGVFKLTEKGKAAANYVKSRAEIAVEYAGKALSDEQRETFYFALESITDNLRILSREGIPNGEL